MAPGSPAIALIWVSLTTLKLLASTPAILTDVTVTSKVCRKPTVNCLKLGSVDRHPCVGCAAQRAKRITPRTGLETARCGQEDLAVRRRGPRQGCEYETRHQRCTHQCNALATTPRTCNSATLRMRNLRRPLNAQRHQWRHMNCSGSAAKLSKCGTFAPAQVACGPRYESQPEGGELPRRATPQRRRLHADRSTPDRIKGLNPRTIGPLIIDPFTSPNGARSACMWRATRVVLKSRNTCNDGFAK